MKNLFEIFYRFLFLGFVSFGGPMAHIGYFRKAFVEKLKWLDEGSYSKLLALSSFLPGPSSSQVGFSIGLKRGGVLGAITAFVAFTFPSFLILYILATFQISNIENELLAGVISALKLFAVVIVADATLGMFKSFCKTKQSIFIFVFATLVLVFFSSAFIQMVVLIISAILGVLFIKTEEKKEEVKTKKPKLIYLSLFVFLLLALPFLANINDSFKLFSVFYEAGSLVFGGGHVVLPLLEHGLEAMVSKEEFLLGYSLAQAVPGPMFTIASYLGGVFFENSVFLGALIATLAIFLPGFLLILAFYDSFESYTNKTKVLTAIAGVNAAVVGLLLAVLINTVIPSGITSIVDILVALGALYVLRNYKISILLIILGFILYGVIF